LACSSSQAARISRLLKKWVDFLMENVEKNEKKKSDKEGD
jgi:hypothetical protein